MQNKGEGMEITAIRAAIEAEEVYSEDCIEAVKGLMQQYGVKSVAGCVNIAMTRIVYELQREVYQLQRGIEFSGKKVM